MLRTSFLAVALALIACPVRAQIGDADFEPPQAAGTSPSGPWTALSGSSRIAPGPRQFGRFFDAGFPTQGALWLDLTNEGTGPAQNPGACNPAQNTPVPGTVAEVRQSFVADATGTISFDWTWITAESLPPTFNDFASIDVIDPATGTPLVNLLYVDNGAGTTPLNAPGAQSNGSGGVIYTLTTSVVGSSEIAPAGPKTAVVPVPMLVPGVTYELCLVAGNDGDALVASHLYLDAFSPALPEAPATNQINRPAASLSVTGLSCLPVGSFPEQRSLDPGQAFTLTVGTESSGRQPFALIATLALPPVSGPGLPVPPGIVDLDLAALATAPSGSLVTVIDGIAPRNFGDVLLGDTGTPGRRSFGFAMPPTGTGVLATLQALCIDPAAAVGSSLSGAVALDFRDTVPLPAAFLGSQALSLGNDDVVAVMLPAGASFPFYGASYTAVQVGSNGILTFGASGQTSGFASASNFLAGEPAIAPLWSNLDPGSGGTVAWSGSATASVFSWTSVPESFVPNLNDTAVRLDATGDVTMRWGRVEVNGPLIGISPGAGSPVGAAVGSSRDLSAELAAGTISGQPDDALFEHFLGALSDLPSCLPQGATTPLVFQPRPTTGTAGDQGYDVF